MSKKLGSHLTYEHRCQIEACLQNGFSKRHIGRFLNLDHTVVVREINRNSIMGAYSAENAEATARVRRFLASSKPKKMTPELVAHIIAMLKETDASPEQVSGRLSKMDVKISHEAIYQMIWAEKGTGGTLYKHLRHQSKKYKKRSGKNAGRGMIPNRVDIDQRPAIVEKKERFGDMELDTIVGAYHKGAIVSIVDRASKYTWLTLVDQGTADSVEAAICGRLEPIAKLNLIHTYTSDNGKEFARHEAIKKKLGGDFYFAKPYHSWERGLNEHTNGLVRQYLPKGTDFRQVHSSNVISIENKLNNRPRKILGFQTPAEAMRAMIQPYALAVGM